MSILPMSILPLPISARLVFRNLAFAAAGLVLTTGTVLAGPTCTEEPKEKWLTEDAMKAKIAEMGYHNIRVFKTTKGNCYEIYGYDKNNQKVEVYFNPVTGDIVKSKIED
jgi:hypothetical protein